MKNGNRTTIKLNLSYETKDKLSNLKLNQNESYDSVIQRLLFLEEKFNGRDQTVTYEYEIFIDDNSKLFKVEWLHDSYIIYYYDTRNHTWGKTATSWGSCDDELVSSFVDALLLLFAKDDARALLMNLTGEISLDGYSVKKL